MNSVIQYCPKCPEHAFQDARYGFRMRVMNPTGKLEKSGKVKCTVCSAIADSKERSTSTNKTSKTK